MQCRIECRHRNTQLIVRIAGRLGEAQVPDLLEVCAWEPLLIVELDDLLSADEAGLDALLRIERQGAQLVGLSLYLEREAGILASERGRDAAENPRC
jgi:hypothetical protein